MIKIAIIAIITLILSSTIKNKNSEFSTIINVVGGVLIVFYCFEMITEILSYFNSIGTTVFIDNDILKLILKIIGIGYICEFVSDIAQDFGNNVISSKVIFGGKIVLCYLMLPILEDLISLLLSFC